MNKKLVMLLAVLGITACSASDIPLIGDSPDRKLTVASVPSREEVIRGDSEPAIVTLDLNSGLRERRLSVSDDLPNDVIIPTTNLNGVPITAALQAILSGTDVSLSWNTGTLGSRLVTVMNLRGPLPDVVRKICSAGRVFCNYRHGSIELSERETFIISLPPIAQAIASTSLSSSSSGAGATTAASSAENTIVDSINKLLDGEKATVDEQGGTIVYTATVDVQERITQYLTQLRTERPLVVLQMYIWEVTLDRENAEGINWTKFKIDHMNNAVVNLESNLSGAATGTGSVSLGAITSGVISADVVASFIATKGRVQTISNPQVTFVSGSSASLKVGGTQRYISEVGTNLSSNVSGTANPSTPSTSTNTVTTDSIDTGLAISVAGTYENGVVFANLSLSIKNLVSLNPTNSGGGIIDLPETTDEQITTVLRVRPGDSLLLAGFVTSNDSSARQGIPTGSETSIPLYDNKTRQNRELVMIVKPSVVLFSDRSEEAAKKKGEIPPAVIVDEMLKVSTQHIVTPTRKIPGADVSPAARQPAPPPAVPVPQPVVVKPADPESVPKAAPIPLVLPIVEPVALPEMAPLTQETEISRAPSPQTPGGFSHAFDRLLPNGQGSPGGSGE